MKRNLNTNKYIKISKKEFVKHKNDMKYIEYYWMYYRSLYGYQTENYEDEIAKETKIIETAILNKNEWLSVKVSCFSKKLKIKKKDYNKLIRYCKIANLLKNECEKDTKLKSIYPFQNL